MSLRILAGDVGGTKTNLAVFERRDGKFHPLAEDSIHNKDRKGLEDIVASFLSGAPALKGPSIDRACFGVAGPVKNQRCEATNLPWVIDARLLGQNLKLAQVVLVNDLEATAWGIPELTDSEVVTLQVGSPEAQGSRAVVAAGTGLGEAGIFWDGRTHWPYATEGGHSDFAPTSDVEIELLRYLKGKFNRVSYERVLSGPGLHNIYNFLKDSGRAPETGQLAEEIAAGDAAAVIAEHAQAHNSLLCQQAVELFISIYGAEAGNVALKTLAVGGVYLGGGIAPKNIEQLKQPGFLKSFNQKGRMQALLEKIPVKVIMNDKTALLGAAHYAEDTHTLP